MDGLALLVAAALLSAALLQEIHGFTFFLRPKEFAANDYAPPFFCYTNEKEGGVAFTRDLYTYEVQKSSTGKVRYRSILNESYFDDGKSDWNFLMQKCDKWDFGAAFDKVANLQHQGGDLFSPVLDRRWNDLPEFVIFQKTEATLLELGSEAHGVFFLSLLAFRGTVIFGAGAAENFTIALNDDDQVHKIEKRTGAGEKTTLAKLEYSRVLHYGGKWTLLAINYSLTKSALSLTVTTDDREILKIENVPIQSAVKWKVKASGEFNADGIASIFKLHQYEVLKPKEKRAVMRTDVTLTSKRPLCLDLTFFSKGPEPKGISARVGTKTFDFLAPSDNKWATVRIKTAELRQGSYTVAVTAESLDTFIGDVRFCVTGPELAETDDWSSVCHSLKAKVGADSLEQGLEPRDAEELCKILSKDDCRGVQLCESSECTCLSGFQSEELFKADAPCTVSCLDSNKFGFNCGQEMRGKCVGGKYNVHTGHCTEGCLPGFLPPACTEPCSSLKKFGPKCEFDFVGKCKGDEYSNQDGTCAQGCSVAELEPPLCTKCAGAKKYGARCQYKFSGNCTDGEFDPISGHCLKGCDPGFIPPGCTRKCVSQMKYGANCELDFKGKCAGNNKDYNSTTGHCPADCKKGYLPPFCTQDCKSLGKFGDQCQHNFTGKCAEGDYDLITGYCKPKKCQPGYLPPSCNQTCSHVNKYGSECQEDFVGKCYNNKYDFLTGECKKRCVDGFIPPLCTDSCMSKNKYGTDKCDKDFVGRCVGKEYNLFSGACKGDCQRGYKPPMCITTCLSERKFGVKCEHEFKGECVNGTDYDIVTGHCVKGCASGFLKPFCTQRCQSNEMRGDECAQNVMGKCVGGKVNFETLHCLEGCLEDFVPPLCVRQKPRYNKDRQYVLHLAFNLPFNAKDDDRDEQELLKKQQSFVFSAPLDKNFGSSTYAPPFFCYTNEGDTAVAFHRRLPKVYLEKSQDANREAGGKVVYRSLQNHTYLDGGKSDCNLMGAAPAAADGCSKWVFTDKSFERVNNFPERLPALTDRRWHELPEVVVHREKNATLLELEDGAEGEVFVSVLAFRATFTLFRSPLEKFALVLDDTSQNLTSRIVKLSKAGKMDVTYALTSSLVLNYGNAWTLISIAYNLTKSSISLSVKSQEQQIMKIENLAVSDLGSGSKWKLVVGDLPGTDYSSYSAIFKLHKFDVLKPKVKSAIKMQAVVQVGADATAQPFCMDVTYFSRGGDKENRKGIFCKVSSAAAPKEMLFQSSFEPSPRDAWVTRRIRIERLPRAGKYNLVVKARGNQTFIGDIRFCVTGPEVVETNDYAYRGCYSLKRGANANAFSTSDNRLNEEEKANLCQAVGRGTCDKVEFCNLRPITTLRTSWPLDCAAFSSDTKSTSRVI